MSFHLPYSRTSRDQIRLLHPLLKPLIRRKLQDLRDNPFTGKALEKELSGYWSIRAKRFRIIYRILQKENTIQIHYVGHRKDIYEILRDIIAKNE